MKQLLIILIIYTSSTSLVSAQLIANAGGNKHVCMDQFGVKDTIEIGTINTAIGGIPPYKYTWYFNFNSITPLSYYLDDTTSSNPKVLSAYTYNDMNPPFIWLKVEDSIGSVAYDSVQVSFSKFYYTIYDYHFILNEGDSVFLNNGTNIGAGVGQLSYLWKPNHGLKDSTKMNGFWAKPDRSIIYYPTVTDSTGCTDQGAPYYYITINHIGLNEDVLNKKIIAFPNPTNGLIHLRLEEDIEIIKVSIYTVLGQVVYVDTKPKTELDISSFRKGIYIIEIQTEKGIVRKKIEKL